MRRDDSVVEEYRPSIFRMEELALDGTFAWRVKAFVDDLLNERPPLPSGRDGLQALRVVEAIVQSWEEKREIAVRTRRLMLIRKNRRIIKHQNFSGLW